MVRMRTGCVVPFHWHTPSEEIVILQGALSYQDALTADYQRFKLNSFLVKQIAPAERVTYSPQREYF
ncbi:hypothetical protein ACFPN2_34400 [Steroidobacter flavus]|uniref:Uncharacterized protein n=1 Tax=Steroidobacter flavus TaxID=1842136 RepID=A0ABV8T5G7_9GAMM